MRFYNREKERQLLDHLYRAGPSFLVLTGRRRVGKTELIKEFCKDKTSLYFYVDQNKSVAILLEEFGQYTTASLNLPEYIRLDTPKALLEFLLSYDKPLVVVFDEFQRFLKIDPSFILQLQKFWDLKGKDSRIFLIVSGSSVGMIRKIFLEGGAPLFKRADNILTLGAFGPRECFGILSDLGITDPAIQLDLYLLFGGTIYYYPFLFKYGCTDLESALDSLVLSDLAPLRREMSDVLIEEFGKEHATYYEILAAIAEGRCTQKEIADYTHLEPTSLPAYLRDLIDLMGIVEYRVPVTEMERRSKKGRYYIRDNFFRFYARYIYRNMSQYRGGQYKSIRDRVIAEWGAFSGWAFEEMVREILRDELTDEYGHIGSWWNRRGDEIDFVALGSQENLAIEIKNSRLSLKESRAILLALEKKISLVTDLSGPVTCGLAARSIEGKEILAREGYFIRDLHDMGL